MTRYFEINGEGHNIRCKLYCGNPNDIRKIVVSCHGFGGHKDNTASEKFAERMLTKYKGTALVAFNWPCHGDDVKKKLSLEDCTTYLDLVVRYLRQKYDAAELFAYATSFGGYMVLKYIAQAENPFRKIALRCPAINMYESLTGAIITPEDREKLEKGKSVPVGFDRKVPVTSQFLADLQQQDIRKIDYLDWAEDILILHGTADEIVSYETAYAFCEDNLIEFIPIEGADHRFRDIRKMDQAINRILEFFQQT